jgi:uncharacterized phage protein gp47/JayE
MALSLQSFSTTVQNMAAAVQGACASLIDLTVGSPVRAILEATASVSLWLQYLVLIVIQGQRLTTSVGSQCDTFGADFGFTRLAATYASNNVVFSRFTATNSALIQPYVAASGTTPASGAQVRSADGTQTFNVTTNTANSYWSTALNGYLIPAGTASAIIPVQAVNAGTQGNVIAGAINTIVGTISGVDTVTNSAAFTNGVNAETDAAFKLRFQNYINTRFQATLAAILYAVTSVAQNITCAVNEYYNPALVYTPGYFTVYADDGSGNPPSGTLALISTAVNNSRALGIAYAVQGPTEIVANVSFTLTVASGVVKANIIAGVEAAVATYIGGLAMGAPMPYSKLSSVIYASNAGIANVTNLLVNSGTADLGGGASQVVRAGTIVAS